MKYKMDFDGNMYKIIRDFLNDYVNYCVNIEDK